MNKYYAIYNKNDGIIYLIRKNEDFKLLLKEKKGQGVSFKEEKELLSWLQKYDIENSNCYGGISSESNIRIILLKKNEKYVELGYSLEEFGSLSKAIKSLIKVWKIKYIKMEVIEKDSIYFDSGTGRGIGTEVRVTDYKGKSIVEKAKLRNIKINEFGNINFEDRTNNYGELAGIFIALKIALKNNIKKIAGDSELVIKWWSNGIYKETVSDETKRLIEKTHALRKEYESQGGNVYYIKGELNPADLGFHK